LTARVILADVMELRIIASRHSAFYSPLIATLGAGFLQREGLKATYRPLAPGERSHELIRRGQADVIQSAVSSNWPPLERGDEDLPVHFAQINCRDGFFLLGRTEEGAFKWRDLEGRVLLADHAAQPLAMLKFAAHLQGVRWDAIRVEDAGSPEEIQAAFRAGRGDYAHLQGPGAQQLAWQGVGKVVAAVGEAMPPVAFSSLMASRAFLAGGAAAAFLRAYARARQWVRCTPAKEVAESEASFFPGVPMEALTAAIARYQALGCWEGGLAISRELYEQALEVFAHSGAISRRWPYEEVVVAPPVSVD